MGERELRVSLMGMVLLALGTGGCASRFSLTPLALGFGVAPPTVSSGPRAGAKNDRMNLRPRKKASPGQATAVADNDALAAARPTPMAASCEAAGAAGRPLRCVR